MKLTHPERVAVRVKAVAKRIAEKIGQRLMGSDIFDQQHVADAIGEFAVVQAPRHDSRCSASQLVPATDLSCKEGD